MNRISFEENSKYVLNHCWNLLFGKAKEYANDEDRLANFKQPCSMMNSNPAEVCLWYDMKHIASISKIAKDINNGILPSREILLEKVGDYLNYGLLFYANVIEEIEKVKISTEQIDLLPKPTAHQG